MMPTRRQFIAASIAAAVGGVGVYSFLVEPHWVEVVHLPMPIEGLPEGLVGKRLLQLNDLHVGPLVDSDYLVRAMRMAAALEPDIVALSGDFVTWRGIELAELGRVLRHVPRGRLATIGVLGNHDYGDGWKQLEVADQVAHVVRESGVDLLRNETRVVGGLHVAGLADLWSPEFGPLHQTPLRGVLHLRPDDGAEMPPSDGDARKAMRVLPAGAPTVVLCHNPDAVDAPLWDGMRGWVLAGHTHGGQVKPPFLPPLVLPVRNRRYTAGAFDVGPGRTLYVNRGVGHLLRVRFNVRPELTLFTLQRA